MPRLILLRHGESEWNLQNKFTGWVDVDLSHRGVHEAVNAGKLLKHYKIDYLFTSELKRAIRTAELAFAEMGLVNVPTERNQALNERHYGDLQGLNKAETGEKFGQEQLKIWRRSYDIAPPNGESLKDTKDRVMPYYFDNILPKLKEGKNVFITAHGNSLRSLVMYLDNLSKEEVLELNIPTGIPLIYNLDDNCNVIDSFYLNPEESDV